MSDALTESDRPIYFIGCDMGGWHNTSKVKGDALAACKWVNGDLLHVEATANVAFFPVASDGPLEKCISAAIKEHAKIIVAIDAALGWPASFARLVAEARIGQHNFSFERGSAIANPYLYRETERFIKSHVLTGAKERPLTAVGDKFGNNSTKAQALVVWLNERLKAFRPPFDTWDRLIARTANHSIIEVYPAASMKSELFKRLVWPLHLRDMGNIGSSDIADAMRCAMTGMCYAAHLGMITSNPDFPMLWMPDEVPDSELNRESIESEGWIFSPRLNKGE